MHVQRAQGVAVDGLGDVLELLHAVHKVVISAQGAAQHRLVEGRRGMVVTLHVHHYEESRPEALLLTRLEAADRG